MRTSTRLTFSEFRGREAGCFARLKSAVKWNLLPRPGSLSTQVWPSISSTRRAEIERPRPVPPCRRAVERSACAKASKMRSEEHTSELQSRLHLVCRLLLEKKKKHELNCDVHRREVRYRY